MVRGKHVVGLAGANEFHIDSPLDPTVLGTRVTESDSSQEAHQRK
jgi:hypothetical protein